MAACATVLVGATFLPADAAQVNVLGLGLTTGGGNNIASLSTNVTGTPTTVGIGNTNGPPIASTTDENGTSANVNLGGAGAGGLGVGGLGLDGLGLGDLGLGGLGLGDLGGLVPGDGSGGGNGAVARVDVAFGGLGTAQRQQLRLRCQTILAAPSGFDTNLVALCRMIARINVTQ
jgi:hypothetical protein